MVRYGSLMTDMIWNVMVRWAASCYKCERSVYGTGNRKKSERWYTLFLYTLCLFIVYFHISYFYFLFSFLRLSLYSSFLFFSVFLIIFIIFTFPLSFYTASFTYIYLFIEASFPPPFTFFRYFFIISSFPLYAVSFFDRFFVSRILLFPSFTPLPHLPFFSLSHSLLLPCSNPSPSPLLSRNDHSSSSSITSPWWPSPEYMTPSPPFLPHNIGLSPSLLPPSPWFVSIYPSSGLCFSHSLSPAFLDPCFPLSLTSSLRPTFPSLLLSPPPPDPFFPSLFSQTPTSLPPSSELCSYPPSLWLKRLGTLLSFLLLLSGWLFD